MTSRSGLEKPGSPVFRFCALSEALNSARGWFSGRKWLHFAALAALDERGSAHDVANSILSTAKALKRQAGWFSPLRSALRYVAGAALLHQNDSAVDVVAELARVRKLFRQCRLRRGGVQEVIAILLWNCTRTDERVQAIQVVRFKELYDEMKSHHWWLTSPAFYPVLAALADEKCGGAHVGARIEPLYLALHAQGFRRGAILLHMASMLSLRPEAPDEIALRCKSLREELWDRDMKVRSAQYKDLALLCLLDYPVPAIVAQMVEHEAELERMKPRPPRRVRLRLAADISTYVSTHNNRALRTLRLSKLLCDMQNTLDLEALAVTRAQQFNSTR